MTDEVFQNLKSMLINAPLRVVSAVYLHPDVIAKLRERAAPARGFNPLVGVDVRRNAALPRNRCVLVDQNGEIMEVIVLGPDPEALMGEQG